MRVERGSGVEGGSGGREEGVEVEGGSGGRGREWR